MAKFLYIIKNGRSCRVARTEQEMKKHILSRRIVIQRGLDTPCWEWTGCKSGSRPYGSVMYQSKTVRVSRLAWRLFVGEIPEKIEVCHRCDNPPCFNPEHLFLGTHQDNMRDAFSKGRIPVKRGVDHHCNKLSVDDVLEMRQLYESKKCNTYQLAEQFGVAQGTAWNIIARKIWVHI